MIAKCLKRECGNLFTAQDLTTAQCPVCKSTVVCNGESDAALIRKSYRKGTIAKSSNLMSYSMHVYQCDDCIAVFGGEAHEDLDHSGITCPFCCGENLSDVGFGELQLTKLSDHDRKIDLIELPLGTRFYVINGAWYGRVAGTMEQKTIFVEATGRTFPLNSDHELVIEIAEEESVH